MRGEFNHLTVWFGGTPIPPMFGKRPNCLWFLDAHASQAPGLSLSQSLSHKDRIFTNLTILLWAISQTYLRYFSANLSQISAVSQPYLSIILGVCQAYPSRNSAVSQPIFSQISVVSQPVLSRISAISQPYPSCISGISRAYVR